MTNVIQKASYFAWAAMSCALRQRPKCPDCSSEVSDIVDTKFGVTQLRRCKSCRLMFRTPTENAATNRLFYNVMYRQGFTTELPDEGTLASLLRDQFRGSPKDFARYIELLRQLGVAEGAKVFDFGASWGYGTWQLRRAGFDVVASEIGRSRREFAARRLGIEMVEDPFDVQFRRRAAGQFDVFFSSHVLEHVPAPRSVWQLARELLRAGGLFVAITPNGSRDAREANPHWRQLWGLVHPNLIDDEYYWASFPAEARLVGSLPLDARAADGWKKGDLRLPLGGAELVFAARV